VLSNDEQRDDDPDTTKLDALLDAWQVANFEDDLHFTCANLIKTITPEPDTDREFESRPTLALYRACLDVAGQPPGAGTISPERLGRWLNKHKDRRRNGRWISRRVLDGRGIYALSYTDQQQTMEVG
jgi:hypothetical protein